MIFDEIKTQYKTFAIKLYDNQVIKLPFKVTQWQRVGNQNRRYIDELRNNNIRIKYFKIMNPDKSTEQQTIGFYYKLYAKKVIPLDKKCWLVKKILERKMDTGYTLREQIEYIWRNKNYRKTTDDILMDRETIILARLAQYLYTGYKNNSCSVLNKKQYRTIKRLEVSDYDNIGDYINHKGNYKLDGEPNTWEFKISTRKKMNRFKNNRKYKGAINRWKKTRTHKTNMIFSYDNKKQGKHHWYREGLVDPTLPYTSRWCMVDTENVFEFNNHKYEISNEVKQYGCNKNGEYQMDKILVYQQNENLYFFDQNIDQIDDKYIQKLE